MGEGSKIILVVEDYAILRGIYVEALTKLGYQVVSADSGASALEVLATLPRLDLVILDRFMPRMDGEEFLARFRGTKFAAIPVLGVSSLPKELPAIAQFAGKVTLYLERPCPIEALIEAVTKLTS